ncbi:carbohydrate ABC transporter permease [Breznakiella homolactica]|uniref:Sugar ABC transporter permease n=1 Tax=Breznakiella homolactica TaxID=2798577 RepID=A0A7T7XKM6_9SPIR|nr:sugar ABC transporter permease [Breznakiella homolactica]QQO08096.1 sugar ABC transporter permease [Breznakiella homolactica]
MRKQLPGFLFVLPALILLLVLMVYPLWQTVLFSFSDVSLPYFETKFVGLKHFIATVQRYEFPRIILNTLIWVFGSVLFQFTFAFAVALFLNNNFKGRIIIQTIALLPWAIPSIVAGNTWKWIMQTDFGLLNAMLKQLGLASLARPWLTDPSLALGSVLFATIWQGYPFLMVMLLAGMKAIPQEQYEAAEVDGANAFQRLISITIPNLKNIIVIVVMLQIVYAWNAFDLIFVMTGGGPGGATEILGLFIYRLGLNEFNFSQSSAVSVMLIGFVLLTMLIRNLLTRGEKIK